MDVLHALKSSLRKSSVGQNTCTHVSFDNIHTSNEPYLEFPYHFRNPLTKLRISNHPLRIETGRFNLPPLPIDNRKCYICEDVVEDELQFPFDCDYYHKLDEYKRHIILF